MEINIDDLRTSDIVWLADEYIHHERNRRIFIDRYVHGHTIERLAESEDMSVAQIKNILRKSMSKVIRHVEVKDNIVRVMR